MLTGFTNCKKDEDNKKGLGALIGINTNSSNTTKASETDSSGIQRIEIRLTSVNGPDGVDLSKTITLDPNSKTLSLPKGAKATIKVIGIKSDSKEVDITDFANIIPEDQTIIKYKSGGVLESLNGGKTDIQITLKQQTTSGSSIKANIFTDAWKAIFRANVTETQIAYLYIKPANPIIRTGEQNLTLKVYEVRTDGTVVENFDSTGGVNWTIPNSGIVGTPNGNQNRISAGNIPGPVTVKAEYNGLIAETVVTVSNNAVISNSITGVGKDSRYNNSLDDSIGTSLTEKHFQARRPYGNDVSKIDGCEFNALENVCTSSNQYGLHIATDYRKTETPRRINEQKIYSTNYGNVYMVWPSDSMGNDLLISHILDSSEEYISLYAHSSTSTDNIKTNINYNQNNPNRTLISKGLHFAYIGQSGNGNSWPIHLHFEMKKNFKNNPNITLHGSFQNDSNGRTFQPMGYMNCINAVTGLHETEEFGEINCHLECNDAVTYTTRPNFLDQIVLPINCSTSTTAIKNDFIKRVKDSRTRRIIRDYFKDPELSFNNSTFQVIIPFFSNQITNPGFDNYDTYLTRSSDNIAYSSYKLNLNGSRTFHQIGVYVNDENNRHTLQTRTFSNSADVNLSMNTSLIGSTENGYGAIIQDTSTSESKLGYRVKLTILDNPNSKIIDDVSLSGYNESIPPELWNNTVPGYYLSAKLVNRGNGFVQWKPRLNPNKDYKVYVYKPAMGTLAYNYKVYINENQYFCASPSSNPTDNSWVPLVKRTAEPFQKTSNQPCNGSTYLNANDQNTIYSMDSNGYVGLDLSNAQNPGIVVVDAIKFDFQRDSLVTQNGNSSLFSGFGLISVAQAADSPQTNTGTSSGTSSSTPTTIFNGTFTTTSTNPSTGAGSTTTNSYLTISALPTTSNIKENSANISYQTNTLGSTQICYSTIALSKGNCIAPVLTKSDVTQSIVHNISLTGLEQNTAYNYFVVSQNGSSTVVSEVNSFKTKQVPIQITSAINTTATEDSINFYWTTNYNSDTYICYSTQAIYSTSNCVTPMMSKVDTIQTKNHSIAITGLKPNTIYYYYIGSMASTSNKAFSTISSKKTLPFEFVYFKLDGNVLDSSKYAMHGKSYGSVFTNTGVSGINNAYNMNGTGYVEVMGDFNETNFSSTLWISTKTKNTGIFSVASGNLGASGHDRHVYIDVNGNLCSRVYSNETICTSGKNYADGQFYHIAHVLNGTNQILYVNGVQVRSGNVGTSAFTWQDRIYIGYSNDAGNSIFKGILDEVRIYNKALSQTEVIGLYNLNKANSNTMNQVEFTSSINILTNFDNATLSWTTNYNSETYICYSESPITFGGACTGLQKSDSNLTTNHSITITGLKPNKTYYYYVGSRVTIGNERFSNVQSFTTKTEGLSIVSGPDASASYNFATITWTTLLSSDTFVRYSTTYYPSASSFPANPSFPDCKNSNLSVSHSCALTNLSPNTTYFYYVGSRTAYGTEIFSNVKSFKTMDNKVMITSGPYLDARTNNSASFSWTTNLPADTYICYSEQAIYTTAQSCVYPRLDVKNGNLTTNHTITVTNLKANTMYYYYVGSQINSTNQAFSGIGTFTTVKPKDCTYPISTQQSCSVSNGYGTQTKSCQYDGTWGSWSSCQATSCSSGYTLINGSCAQVAQFSYSTPYYTQASSNGKTFQVNITHSSDRVTFTVKNKDGSKFTMNGKMYLNKNGYWYSINKSINYGSYSQSIYVLASELNKGTNSIYIEIDDNNSSSYFYTQTMYVTKNY